MDYLDLLLEDDDLFDGDYDMDDDFDYEDDDYLDEDYEYALSLYEEPARKISMHSGGKKDDLDEKYADYVAKRRAKGKSVLSKKEWLAKRSKLKKAAKIAAITGGSAALATGAYFGGREIYARNTKDYKDAKAKREKVYNSKLRSLIPGSRKRADKRLDDALNAGRDNANPIKRIGAKFGNRAGKIHEMYGYDSDFYDYSLEEALDLYDFDDYEAACFEEGFNEGFTEVMEYYEY